MKNFYFIINDIGTFELWVDGKCITDCFYLTGCEADLMEQLVQFADVPCYKKVYFEEIRKKLLDI